MNLVPLNLIHSFKNGERFSAAFHSFIFTLLSVMLSVYIYIAAADYSLLKRWIFSDLIKFVLSGLMYHNNDILEDSSGDKIPVMTS